MTKQIYDGTRLVLNDRLAIGTLTVENGLIDEVRIDEEVPAGDLDGDYLMPGLVELHTDHLENHYAPRPSVRWNPVASIQAHDAQVAGSGITTVFDALRLGMDYDSNLKTDDMRLLADAIVSAQEAGRLRVDHFIHLRCEVSTEDIGPGFSHFRDNPLVRIASLMDHTPGQRQFTSMDKYKEFYKDKAGISDEEFDAYVAERVQRADRLSPKNRALIAEQCHQIGIVLASHDDATDDHVREAIENEVHIAEFPTTVDAARASRDAGMKILMGAPNIVRGGSHSGNISAQKLAEAGLLDVLSSDYIPFSLLHAVFMLAERVDGIDLPDATRMVTRTPAEAAGLQDRGVLEPGKRADFIQASYHDGVPVIRSVWREGRRVA
ncbi:MAG: alpha-D-ribose 1-methylphosphonate 5-triphosphate diphosphatase [Pseudomonadota bacterium]